MSDWSLRIEDIRSVFGVFFKVIQRDVLNYNPLSFTAMDILYWTTQQYNNTNINNETIINTIPLIKRVRGLHGTRTAGCVQLPSGQVWGRFLLLFQLFFLFFGKGASGTICSTMGCNFTRQCTFALKLLLFPPQHPDLPPVPLLCCTAAMTCPCHSTEKQTAWLLRNC